MTCEHLTIEYIGHYIDHGDNDYCPIFKCSCGIKFRASWGGGYMTYHRELLKDILQRKAYYFPELPNG